MLSDERQEYADGLDRVRHLVPAGAEAVEFTNGSEVTIGQAASSPSTRTRGKAQIVETVRQHLDKERTLRPLGVKVLSLVFIDRVANYRAFDDDGNPTLGPIAQWFEEAYVDLASKPRYAALDLPPVDQVHDGYFSVDNKRRPKDTRGDSAADVDTYDLIMRDKEKLLSLDEPLRFIFSHSALREGWDNPNVFQICTLNESKSTDRKRQEIGRGLRLPVDQSGERVHDPQVNRLTIIANEAYDQFARELQTEYEEDTGQRFGIVPRQAFAKLAMPAAPGEPRTCAARAGGVGDGVGAPEGERLPGRRWCESCRSSTRRRTTSSSTFPSEVVPLRAEITDAVSRYVFANRIINARKRQTVRFRKQVSLDPDFKALWERISKRTKYRVSLSTDDLVERGRVGDRRRGPDRGAEGPGPGRRAGAQQQRASARTSTSISMSTRRRRRRCFRTSSPISRTRRT